MGAVVVALLALALGSTGGEIARGRTLAAAAFVPLAILLVPGFADHRKWSLIVVPAAFAVLAATTRSSGSPPRAA